MPAGETAPDAEKQLFQLIEAGETKILLNFEMLDYISSAGLHVLLESVKRLKAADGELRICSLNDVVGKVFDIAGFMTILKVFGSESEALKGF